MTTFNPEVVKFVRSALEGDPSLSSRELRERAASIDESVLELSGRQFHAKYALQVRRDLGTAVGAVVSPTEQVEDNPALRILAEGYEERKSELNRALSEAFEKALAENTLSGLGTLLQRIESEIEALKDF